MEQLQETINGIPKHDILLIIGDFNAKVDSSNKGHKSAMGKHGIGERNENGERLLDVCEIMHYISPQTKAQYHLDLS